MSVLRSFASVDEMLSAMAEDNEVADSSTRPWQKALAVGDCFLRKAHGVRIWCEVLDPGVFSYPGDYDQEERDALKAEAEVYNEPHMQNYRFCRAYSSYEPFGELGDVHVSTAESLVSRADFDAVVADLKQLGKAG